MSKRTSVLTIGLLSAAVASVARAQEYDVANDTFIDSGSPGTINPATGMENDPGSVVDGEDIYSYGDDTKVKAVASTYSSSYPYVSHTHVLFQLPASFWTGIGSQIVASAFVDYYPFNDSMMPANGQGQMELHPMTQAFTIGNGLQNKSPVPPQPSTDGGATWDTYDGSESDLWATPGGDYDSGNFVDDTNGTLPVSAGNVPFFWDISSLLNNSTTRGELENYGALIKVINENTFPPGTLGPPGIDDFVSFDSAQETLGTAFLPNINVTYYTPLAATSGGSWSSGGSWTGGQVPSGVGTAALLSGATSNNTTVTLDGSYTLSVLGFSGSNSYVLKQGSGGGLTFDNGGSSGTATVNDLSGTHFIQVSLVLNSYLSATVYNAGDTLNVSGNISGAGGLFMGGNGTMILSGTNSYAGATTVNNGVLSLATPAALPSTSAVTISGGTLKLSSSGVVYNLSSNSLLINFGNLDIGNNAVLLSDSGNPRGVETEIQQFIENAVNGATATAGGIISSYASANGMDVAYADAGDTNMAGTKLATDNPGDIVIEPALAGDTDLSGTVDIHDLQNLLSDFNQPGFWDQGNFNGHDDVDISDLQALLSNFNTSAALSYMELSEIENLAGQFGFDAIANPDGKGFTLTAVPEPASGMIGLVGLSSLALRRRRAAQGTTNHREHLCGEST
jgi:autotransporter-associated beta strand protein